MSRALSAGGAIALVCVLLAGCDDPVSPASIAGVYQLEAVAGDPLPAIIYTTPDASYWIIEEVLQLSSTGTGTLQHTREIRYADGQLGVASFTTPLYYRVRSGRIEITFVCPPNALCVAGPHLVGRRTSEGLELEDQYSERTPLTYSRVALLP